MAGNIKASSMLKSGERTVYRDDNEAECQRVREEINFHLDSVSEGAVEAKKHTTSFDLD